MNNVFRLLVGLGNPGRKYVGTRHNIGFEVVEEIARRAGTSFTFEKRWRSEFANGPAGLLLIKPQTFMNLSGEAVASFSHFFKIDPSEILVIYDDIAFPLGELRIRPSGSAGGHNGLNSIICLLGTDKIARLRVGIGNSLDISLENFVLSSFTSAEQQILPEAIARAADAALYANASGIEQTMNQYNQRITTNTKHGQE